MTDLTLRNEKGETLTFDELDSNFLALDSSISNVGNTITNLGADYVTLATDQTITGQKTFANNLTADSVSTDLLRLNDSAEFSYNSTDHVLQVVQDGITLEMGSNWFYAKSDTAISKGEVVYLDSAEIDTPIVVLADESDAEFNRDRVLGLAAVDIAAGNYGYIIEEGTLSDIDTSSFIVGDIVYLDPATPGGLTKTVPTPPDPVIELGLVTRSDATTGRIYVRVVQNYSTDDTPEGSDNYYYTSTRVDSDIDARVTKSFVDALGVNAASVDGFNGIGIYDSVGNLLNGA
jgi:hypothetical protein